MRKTILTIINLCLLAAIIFICIKIFMPNDIKAPDVPQKDDKEIVDKYKPIEKETVPEEVVDETVFERIFDSQINTDSSEIPIARKPADLPESIKLKGTVTGSPLVARAMLEILDDNGKPKSLILKINENIDDFTLSQIFKDHVVFSHNQQEVSLWIQISESESEILKQDKTSQSQTVTTQQLELNMPVTKEALRKTLDSFSLDAEWEIVKSTNNNESEGLKLRNIKALSPIATLGVLPDDTIKSINGQKLTDFKKAYQVIQKAKLQKRLSIVVNREGNEIEFNAEISN